MRVQAKEQMTVNAPAGDVWRVLAHEFDQIGLWSSGIRESSAVLDCPIPDGATVGARLCLSDGFGGDVQEEFTYYDEQAMRFGYKASGEMPWFINSGENNWSVHPMGAEKCQVAFSAVLDLKLFPGVFMILVMPLLTRVWGRWTLEELKHYVEQGQPHPRKLKAQRKQARMA